MRIRNTVSNIPVEKEGRADKRPGRENSKKRKKKTGENLKGDAGAVKVVTVPYLPNYRGRTGVVPYMKYFWAGEGGGTVGKSVWDR
jgi:hypothetical protein